MYIFLHNLSTINILDPIFHRTLFLKNLLVPPPPRAQSRLTILEFNAMFCSNGDVHEEFTVDKHYVGHVHNCPASSFCVVFDCHEGFMVLVCARDEEHPSQYGWWKHCLHPILFELASTLVKLKWNICCLSTKDHNVLRTYLGWDPKKGFKWTMDSTYGPVGLT